ncbi:MAG TPA: choice-of-anchor D domain-containing protein [Solirubrobacterales bacterium]|nr:choice-of-anchor D domain-containing protein [Solirubrobacterales bacterium]
MSKLLAVSALVLALFALPASGLAAPPEGSGLPLAVSPPALVFEKTTVGNQAPGKEVDLFNEGEEEAAIDKIAIEGEDAAAFNLNSNVCGAIFQNNHCGLWFTFMADSVGEKQATVVITFKNGRPAESFAISGTAVEPQLTFSPSSYDFGLQRVYEMRNTYLQLTNSGEASVQVNHFEMLGGSGSFWTDNNGNGCQGYSLQPGESCNFEVDFNPQDAISYAAELRTIANGYSFTAALSGQGGRAIIDATPNPVDFGATTVGAISGVQEITITNSGNIPAGFFIGIVAGGDSASFQLLSENCTGTELMPSSSCTARVRFRPQDAGPKVADMAFFGDNDGGAMVGLKGEGVAPAVTLAPLSFDFGPQAAGEKSAARDFVVRNDGTTPLQLDGAAIVGADLDQFALAGDGCTGETLVPGAECLVRVRFAPDSAGAKAAKLRIGGGDGAFVAALTGSGEDALARADGYRDGAFGHPGPPPPRPWRQARHRRFVRGESISVGKLARPHRVKVRAGISAR